MTKTLFFYVDAPPIGTCFGTSPKGKGITGDQGLFDQYYSLSKRVWLKRDLGWREVQELQNIFRKAEIWEDFPTEGLKFICAELRAGDEDQRIDLLYLRNDGGIYVCELKIGGTSLDSHGQLIRYIADLHYQTIDTNWLVERRVNYLKECGKSDRDLDAAAAELRTFLESNEICDRHIRLIKNSGIIADEDFKPQMFKAVRYLNEYCAFSIRLLRIQAYVAHDWQPTTMPYQMRLQIDEAQ